MNWFQRLRRYIIIKTAENYYDKMARRCNELYKATGHHHYIIIDPIKGNRITITDRAGFRAMKRIINDSGARMSVKSGERIYVSETMYDVHNGCYYSSMLQSDLDKLMLHPEENARKIHHAEVVIEARRRSYIKWTLENAKQRRGLFARIAEWFKRRRENDVVRKELNAIKKGANNGRKEK